MKIGSNLGVKFGSQIRESDLGVKFGSQVWGSNLGVKFGMCARWPYFLLPEFTKKIILFSLFTSRFFIRNKRHMRRRTFFEKGRVTH